MTTASFDEIIWKIKSIKHEETRRDSEDYLELITSGTALKDLHGILTTYFGPPHKPAGDEADAETHDKTKDFGGIQKDQVLYLSKHGGNEDFAMIWPWKNGDRATVKIIQGAE